MNSLQGATPVAAAVPASMRSLRDPSVSDMAATICAASMSAALDWLQSRAVVPVQYSTTQSGSGSQQAKNAQPTWSEATQAKNAQPAWSEVYAANSNSSVANSNGSSGPTQAKNAQPAWSEASVANSNSRSGPALAALEDYLLHNLRAADVSTGGGGAQLFNVEQVAFLVEECATQDDRKVTRDRVARWLSTADAKWVMMRSRTTGTDFPFAALDSILLLVRDHLCGKISSVLDAGGSHAFASDGAQVFTACLYKADPRRSLDAKRKAATHHESDVCHKKQML